MEMIEAGLTETPGERRTEREEAEWKRCSPYKKPLHWFGKLAGLCGPLEPFIY